MSSVYSLEWDYLPLPIRVYANPFEEGITDSDRLTRIVRVLEALARFVGIICLVQQENSKRQEILTGRVGRTIGMGGWRSIIGKCLQQESDFYHYGQRLSYAKNNNDIGEIEALRNQWAHALTDMPDNLPIYRDKLHVLLKDFDDIWRRNGAEIIPSPEANKPVLKINSGTDSYSLYPLMRYNDEDLEIFSGGVAKNCVQYVNLCPPITLSDVRDEETLEAISNLNGIPWRNWISNNPDPGSTDGSSRQGIGAIPFFASMSTRGEEDVRALREFLDDRIKNVIVVSGASGAGKSSASMEALWRSNYDQRCGLLFNARYHTSDLISNWKTAFTSFRQKTSNPDPKLPLPVIVIENAEEIIKDGRFIIPDLQELFERLLKSGANSPYKMVIIGASSGNKPLLSPEKHSYNSLIIKAYSPEEMGALWHAMSLAEPDSPEFSVYSPEMVVRFFTPFQGGSPMEAQLFRGLVGDGPLVDLLRQTDQALVSTQLQQLFDSKTEHSTHGLVARCYSHLSEEAMRLVWLVYAAHIPMDTAALAAISQKIPNPSDLSLETIANDAPGMITQATVIRPGRMSGSELLAGSIVLSLHAVVAGWLHDNQDRAKHLFSGVGSPPDNAPLDNVYRVIAHWAFEQIDDFLYYINGKDSDTIIGFFDMEQAGFASQLFLFLTALAQTHPESGTTDQMEEDAALVSLYLTGHYWWDIYVHGFPLCKPLLDACKAIEKRVRNGVPDSLKHLNAIQENWPEEYRWKYFLDRNRPDFRRRLRASREALKALYVSLKLDTPLEEFSKHSWSTSELVPGYRQLAKGIVELYLSESVAYLNLPDGEKELRAAAATLRRMRTVRWMIPFHDVVIADWHLYNNRYQACALWILHALLGYDPLSPPEPAIAGIGSCIVFKNPNTFYFGAEYFNRRSRYWETSDPVDEDPQVKSVNDLPDPKPWRWCEPCAEAEALILASELFQKQGELMWEEDALIIGSFHAFEYCYAPHPADNYTSLFARETVERTHVALSKRKTPASRIAFAQKVHSFWKDDDFDVNRFADDWSKDPMIATLSLFPPLPDEDEKLVPSLTDFTNEDDKEAALLRVNAYAGMIQATCEARMASALEMQTKVKAILLDLAKDASADWNWSFH